MRGIASFIDNEHQFVHIERERDVRVIMYAYLF